MINRQLTSAFRSPRIVLRALLSVALLTTACGGQGPDTGGMSGMSGQPSEAAGDHTGHVMAPSQGALQAELRGYRFDPAVTTIPSGAAGRFTFRVVNPSGAAQTQFAVDQTKLLHLYAIRRDLTHFQHEHPEMTTDGTWTTSLNVDSPGPYRVVADFIALDEKGKQVPLALGVDVSVPGDFVATPLPASASTTAVEAYQVELKGNPVASMDRKLAFTIT